MKIALLGDIAFFGKFCIEKNISLFDYFKEIAEYLRVFDVVIANLETPFTISKKEYGGKSAYIKSHPSNIDLLKYLNVTHVSLANNHIFDFGYDGYALTKEILEESGIEYFGIENKSIEITKDSNKIALHGYCCYSSNPIGIYNGKGVGINKLNVQEILNKMIQFRDQGFFNIISVHAGEEHVNYPNHNQLLLTRKLAEACNYIYHGHHPHVLQGVEKYKGSIIAHSLGNFCFDDVYTSKSKDPLVKLTENNKESAILEIEIKDNQIVSDNLMGIYAGKDNMQMNCHEICAKVNQYTAFLTTNKDNYIKERASIINSRIADRKKNRNLKWYIKRMNINTVRMIVNGRTNTKKYKKNIVEFL